MLRRARTVFYQCPIQTRHSASVLRRAQHERVWLCASFLRSPWACRSLSWAPSKGGNGG